MINNNWKEVKNHIVAQVVNKKTLQLMEGNPLFKELTSDLVEIAGAVIVRGSDLLIATVEAKQLKEWGINEEELFAIAEENAKAKVKIKSLYDTAIEVAEAGGVSEEELEEIKENCISSSSMYTVTNEMMCYGAIEIFLVAEEFCKEYGNFVMIPSSIDETIIIPVSLIEDEERLFSFNLMIPEANITTVPRGRVLSNHIYACIDGKWYDTYEEIATKLFEAA